MAEQSFDLKAKEELRIDVTGTENVVVRLVKGTAEAFGVELGDDTPYTLKPASKLAFSTWHGATLSVSGGECSAYISGDSSMVAFANVHQRLEVRREIADKFRDALGPRVRTNCLYTCCKKSY